MILDFAKAEAAVVAHHATAGRSTRQTRHATFQAELERQAQQAVQAERERVTRGCFECPKCGGEYPDHRDFCVWSLAPEAP